MLPLVSILRSLPPTSFIIETLSVDLCINEKSLPLPRNKLLSSGIDTSPVVVITPVTSIPAPTSKFPAISTVPSDAIVSLSVLLVVSLKRNKPLALAISKSHPKLWYTLLIQNYFPTFYIDTLRPRANNNLNKDAKGGLIFPP